MYIVPVFGITGVGKSQLCNFLFQDITNTKFKVGHGNDSETTIKNLIEQDSLGLPILENKFCLIDTPGGDDSKGKDIENLEEIAKFLQKKGKVHCILLVFSFTVRNKQGAVTEYLKKLSAIFTPMEFYSHVIIILTNYPLKPRKIEKDKKKTYMEEINEIIRKSFEFIDKRQIDFFFIDSLPCEDNEGHLFYDKDQLKNRNDIIKDMENICSKKSINMSNNFLTYVTATNRRSNIDEYYYYKIKGSYEGYVWGNGIYTDDSNISKAAVLEGKCRYGEEIIIRIRMLKGLSYYSSKDRNGVHSSSWGSWPASYIFTE